MTLFYDNIRSGEPQTHMLVIGVGAYPHLADGLDSQVNYEWAGRNLGQLSSPPRSAKAFAEWSKTSFRNPEAPLGSIDLLISEQLKTIPGERLPTMGEIENAVGDWVRRCNTHPECIAIFYFCGHGLMVKGARLLLARDFAALNKDEFRNALHFDLMHSAMGDKCRAPNQYFFIDACSYTSAPDKSPNTAQAIFSQGTLPGQGLGIVASGPGESAFSEEEQISRFTHILLACLSGRGCEKLDPPSSQWAITGMSLYSMLCDIYKYEYGKDAPFDLVGRPRKKPVLIYEPPPPPQVPVTISFDPQALEHACMTLLSDSGTYRFVRDTPHSSEWKELSIPSGRYLLSVEFPEKQYQNIDGEWIWIDPPGPWPSPQPLPLKLILLST